MPEYGRGRCGPSTDEVDAAHFWAEHEGLPSDNDDARPSPSARREVDVVDEEREAAVTKRIVKERRDVDVAGLSGNGVEGGDP